MGLLFRVDERGRYGMFVDVIKVVVVLGLYAGNGSGTAPGVAAGADGVRGLTSYGSMQVL